MHYEILIQLFITVVISCACCQLLVVTFYFKIMPYSGDHHLPLLRPEQNAMIFLVYITILLFAYD
jgi:hypothetical protein